MSLSSAGNIFNLIREINLNDIKAEADARFALLVVGEPALAQELAEQLSAEPGKRGIHPWLTVQPAPLPLESGDLSRYDLALLVTGENELSEGQGSTLRRLHEARVPTLVVVVNEAASSLVGAELPRLGESARVILPSLDPAALQIELVPALVRAAPSEHKLALARHLPPLRTPIVTALIEDTSRANAIYAATTGLAEVVPVLNLPLNAADILMLTKNQLVMAYKIALATGKQGEPMEVMGEIASVIGGGFLFRQVARELVGLIPVVGIVPKVAVSYAGTWVIGRTVYLWASEGDRLNPSEARRFYDEAMARGRRLAETLLEKMRRDAPALPAPEGTTPTAPRRWWDRFRRPAAPALPTPEGTAPAEAPAQPLHWWQRLLRRLPFFGRRNG